ncbi:DUF2637 domain-containing protein [Mycobacterium aquaticum]|uniref:DUF2637 domain-containing protein n=1 Tax=Mycobacterium aquaticum TaxID=1927124 RepID=A0A1X0ABZ0_9MYCO|nr:DUF2637 domain-containing protein [Mycobacterium aquaticum]ORA27368.1 hypothetical protein BST13_30380 [Mycobacterium aquaticum]
MSDTTYWRTVLVTFVAISVAGNTGHVLLVDADHRWAAAALAAVPPLGLVLITHGLTAHAGKGRGAMYWSGVAGAVAIAAMAFVASFVTLRDLAVQLLHCPPLIAALLPLVIDAVIAVASALAVATHRAEAAVYDAALQLHHKPVHRPEQATVHREPDTAVHSTEEPAGDVEQPVHQRDQSAPEPPVHWAAPAVTSDDEPVQTAEQAVHPEPETDPVQSPERPRLVAVHRTDAPVSVRRRKPTTPVQPVHTPQAEVAVQSNDGAPPVQPVHTAQAEAVVQAGGVELPVERVAEVFARRDAGQSQNVIANAKVANKRTVAKLLAAREAVADADDPDRASVTA